MHQLENKHSEIRIMTEGMKTSRSYTSIEEPVPAAAVVGSSGKEESPDDSCVYDESSYPAKAESDEEIDVAPGSTGDSVMAASSRVSKLLVDDTSCAVCAEVLVDPCTLHCGHSFCQLCLASIWKSNLSRSPLHQLCPICRQPWANFPGVNIQLR